MWILLFTLFAIVLFAIVLFSIILFAIVLFAIVLFAIVLFVIVLLDCNNVSFLLLIEGKIFKYTNFWFSVKKFLLYLIIVLKLQYFFSFIPSYIKCVHNSSILLKFKSLLIKI